MERFDFEEQSHKKKHFITKNKIIITIVLTIVLIISTIIEISIIYKYATSTVKDEPPTVN